MARSKAEAPSARVPLLALAAALAAGALIFVGVHRGIRAASPAARQSVAGPGAVTGAGASAADRAKP